MSGKWISFSAVCLLLLGGCDAATPVAGKGPEAKTAVDLVLHNGTVLILDAAGQSGTTLVVDDGLVVAVGNDDLRAIYQADQSIDLAGQTVMPGFNDTHVHINGRPPYYVALSKVTSIAQMMELVAKKAEQVGPGNWVTGYGWSEDQFSENRKPNIQDLDAAAPENPVMLTRAGAHSAVFSSAAFELANIDAQTPNPEGGVIERDEQGRLNGIIRERHEALVGQLIPPPLPESLRASLVAELQALFALGITSITQAISTVDYFSEWQAAYAAHPSQLPRASIQHYFEGRDRMRAFRERVGEGDDFLSIGPIKLMVDGGFTGPAAYTKKPYKGEDSYRGALNLSEQKIEEVLYQAHEDGWQLGVHAIGDAAIELVVEKMVAMLQNHPRADHRHYLNHFTIMPSMQTMDQMAAYNIAITQQPNFLFALEGRYREYLDGARLQHNNSMATPMGRGVHVAMSSDILPLGPWTGVYVAVTRQGPSGEVYAPTERISRLAALRAYTSSGAYLNRQEHQKGTLEPGMWADFIVLEQNPMTVAEEEILQMQTNATYLAGKQVYARATR